VAGPALYAFLPCRKAVTVWDLYVGAELDILGRMTAAKPAKWEGANRGCGRAPWEIAGEESRRLALGSLGFSGWNELV